MDLALDNITAVVLAGGFGTRIRHVLPDLPKPMAPVAGRPFIEWVVRFIARQGIRRVVISTGYMGEKIENHFAAESFPEITISCVRETTPLGTGGGFLNAAAQSGESPDAWMVLNGDSLILADLEPMVRALNVSGASAGILGLDVPDASRYGTLQFGENGELIRFSEKQPGAATINAGVYLFRAATLKTFPPRRPLSFEQDVFPSLLERHARIAVTAVKAPFLDIGTETSLKDADAFIRGNIRAFDPAAGRLALT
jgi:D-glycero-alpha-D-manno-heptose 1-phosphate guanylyltransferase